MKTTWNKEVEATKANMKAWGISMDDYVERDEAVERLTKEFYEKVGLGADGEFERIDLDDEDFEKAAEIAKGIKGWAEYLGEETEVLFKDGERMGTMVVSCRGNMYRAEMWCEDWSYEASNMWQTKDQWNKAA
jgi:hypothetical protein